MYSSRIRGYVPVTKNAYWEVVPAWSMLPIPAKIERDWLVVLIF